MTLKILLSGGRLARNEPEACIPVIRSEHFSKLLDNLAKNAGNDDDRELRDLFEEAAKAIQKVAATLLDIMHVVCKNLDFWESRAQGPEEAKLRFMLLERGPWAFLVGVASILHGYLFEKGEKGPSLMEQTTARIAERVAVLHVLRDRLATAVGEVYKQGHLMARSVAEGEPRKGISLALASTFNALDNVAGIYELPKSDYKGESRASASDDVRGVDMRNRGLGLRQCSMNGRPIEWRNGVIRHALAALLQDVEDLETQLRALIQHYRRPRKAARRWIRYTGTAVGLGLAASWVVRHSRLAGSDDLEKWMQQAKDATVSFYQEHVKEPALSLGSELFATFRARPRSIVEREEVTASEDSLRRMLRSFVENTGTSVDKDASDQDLMEAVMHRYEKEMAKPLQNLVVGDLARALLIQIQKLKLDTEVAMLELDQVLRSNEINFALLAAFPALLLSVLLAYLLRRLLLRNEGAGANRREAQTRRRMLMAEAERAILVCLFEGRGKEAPSSTELGFIIFAVNHLYRAVRRHALSTHEWPNLREDILDLAQPFLPPADKVLLTARMERIYECLTPIPPV